VDWSLREREQNRPSDILPLLNEKRTRKDARVDRSGQDNPKLSPSLEMLLTSRSETKIHSLHNFPVCLARSRSPRLNHVIHPLRLHNALFQRNMGMERKELQSKNYVPSNCVHCKRRRSQETNRSPRQNSAFQMMHAP
jgi:hypothetical protein